jgi:ubiquinone/menaquinone biosynthesis C-methylase UbiE
MKSAVTSFEAIQISYDLQAGSYTNLAASEAGLAEKAAFAEALAPHIGGGFVSLLDAGVGEATSLAPVLELIEQELDVLAFDSSVSRLMWARRNLSRISHQTRLFAANTAHIPLPDRSVDVVLSVHSLEPNGGREAELLRELLRVTARRMVLIEPTTTFASPSQRARMERLGYCQNLAGVLDSLGVEIAVHEPWSVNSNRENVADLIIVDIQQPADNSSTTAEANRAEFVAPTSLARLEEFGSGLYSRTDGLFFPRIADLPILIREKGIIATQLLDDRWAR